MKYDPDKKHRRSMRLEGYNYAQQGAYFVTICTFNRECLFGEVKNGEMHLNDFGMVAYKEWKQTSVVRPYVELDEFAIMPNHIHGIVVIESDQAGTPHVTTDEPTRTFGKPISGSLSSIVGAYKSMVTRQINERRVTPNAELWQKRFYDVIIRNEKSLNDIRQYILSNPQNWESDLENPANLKK